MPLDATDATLPLPIRGSLCHSYSCYDLPVFVGEVGVEVEEM